MSDSVTGNPLIDTKEQRIVKWVTKSHSDERAQRASRSNYSLNCLAGWFRPGADDTPTILCCAKCDGRGQVTSCYEKITAI